MYLSFQTCLVGAGPSWKHTALEAVTIVLDLPPPQPGSMLGIISVDRVSASDPKSALALQKLVQASVSLTCYFNIPLDLKLINFIVFFFCIILIFAMVNTRNTEVHGD